jgi:hypothetical protein
MSIQSEKDEYPRSSSIYNLKVIEDDTNTFLKLQNVYQSVSRCFKTKLTRKDFYTGFLFKRVPVFNWLPKYKIKQYLFPDIIAGLTVGIMNIPQGMAYALLATLNPVNGLYISLFPVLIYCLFGTSNHLAIGE